MEEPNMVFSLNAELLYKDVMLFDLHGILEQNTCSTFIHEVISRCNDQIKTIVINLSNTIYISPSGLETFDKIKRKYCGHEQKLILLNIPEIVGLQIERYGINSNIIKCMSINEVLNLVHMPCTKVKEKGSSKILVMSETELIKKIQTNRIGNYDCCISIRNPDEIIDPIILNNFKNILELKFYDAYDVNHLGPMQTIKRIPEVIDIEQLIKFYNENEAIANGFVVHCWQGISRSPAIALCLLYLKYKSEVKAKEELILIRPEARPHLLITQIFDSISKSNLTKVAEEIRNETLENIKKKIKSTASI